MSYERCATVFIHPYTRQIEGEEAVIGRLETGAFLVIPSIALEALDLLDSGKTVGETQDIFFERHGVVPDLADLLSSLAAKGFVEGDTTSAAPPSAGPPVRRRPEHFSGISSATAQKIFSKRAAIAVAPLIALAVVLVLRDPDLLPGRYALFFAEDRTFKTLWVALFAYSSLFLHEMGHLVAARARGVGATLGVGHRLWFLVAETDLSGLWSIPRHQRYLPLLAGTIVDLVSMAVLVLVLALHRADVMMLSPWPLEVLNALFIVYVLRVVWQLYFFVRTDFYYVVATALGCKNLLGDTETFLRNLMRRLLRRGVEQDQTHLPAHERTWIRVYSIVWVLGRMLSLGVLILVSIPVTVRYLSSVGATLSKGYAHSPSAFVDSIAWLVLSFSPLVVGIVLWIRSLVRNWRPA